MGVKASRSLWFSHGLMRPFMMSICATHANHPVFTLGTVPAAPPRLSRVGLGLRVGEPHFSKFGPPGGRTLADLLWPQTHELFAESQSRGVDTIFSTFGRGCRALARLLRI